MQSKMSIFKSSSHRRSIYASSLANVSPIKARIVEKDGVVKLETYEPHDQYKHVHVDKVSLFKYTLHMLFRLWGGNVWNVRFSITADGTLHSPNNDTLSSRYYHEKNNYSYNEKSVDFQSIYKLIHFQPDLLFAIPQTIWDAFIAKLPDQQVVSKLNLSKHRHLYQSYNWIVANQEHKLKKAELVGMYHFLNSFYLDTQPHYRPDREAKLVSVLSKDIEEGKDIMTILNRYFPEMTPTFFRRFAHCPEVRALMIVSKLISPRFMNKQGKCIDSKIRDDVIAALPCSRKSPQQFMNMLDIAKDMERVNFESLLKVNIFYDQRKQFHKPSTINFDSYKFRDYKIGFAEDLFYSEVIRRIMQYRGIPLKINHSHGMELEEIIFLKNEYNDFLLAIESNLDRLMVEKLSLSSMNELQERWHRNITVINAAKPEALDVSKWHALFAPQRIGSVSFTCLTTSTQLKDEGSEMQHCVGGYVNRCIENDNHIIRVESDSGHRSTLELKAKGHGSNEFLVAQNVSLRNSEAHRELVRATNQLLKKIKHKQIQLNPARGEIKRPAEDYAPVTIPAYPFNIADETIPEAIYQVYKNTKTLPAFLVAESYADLVSNNPLVNDMFNEIVESLIDKYEHLQKSPCNNSVRM